MNRIRIIVIDDERSAREELKRELQKHPDVEVVAEARNADEAKLQVETLRPDLIFLDIQMPEKSGFDLLEWLDEIPAVIFVTAFDQYAVKAFEVNALDYLVKPFREERFLKALEKARNELQDHTTTNRKVFIRDGQQYFFVQLSDISLVESKGNYTCIYFNGKKALLKRSLRQWEESISTAGFFRANRTQLVNKQYVEDIRSQEKGRITIRLKTGTVVEVSDRQSVKFKQENGI